MRTLVSRVPMSSENLAGRTVGGYRLLERVGEGGTAEVYRAEHPERGPCAFKVLRQRLRGDPTAVKRFLREAGYGSRVRHPGVVRTYDYGEADGLYYLALEWADGNSLADYVHRAGPLAPAQAVRLVRQLADALGAAHQAGIIHRDLKPENIIYDPATERVNLLDFGSRGTRSCLPRSGLRAPGSSWGRSSTWRPKRSQASWWTAAPTSSASRRSRTGCSPAHTPSPDAPHGSCFSNC